MPCGVVFSFPKKKKEERKMTRKQFTSLVRYIMRNTIASMQTHVYSRVVIARQGDASLTDYESGVLESTGRLLSILYANVSIPPLGDASRRVLSVADALSASVIDGIQFDQKVKQWVVTATQENGNRDYLCVTPWAESWVDSLYPKDMDLFTLPHK